MSDVKERIDSIINEELAQNKDFQKFSQDWLERCKLAFVDRLAVFERLKKENIFDSMSESDKKYFLDFVSSGDASLNGSIMGLAKMIDSDKDFAQSFKPLVNKKDFFQQLNHMGLVEGPK